MVEATSCKDIVYSMRQILFLTEKYLSKVLLSKNNISFSQFMILASFYYKDVEATANSSHGFSQSCIAQKLSVTEATISRHIFTLVRSGYLKKDKDTDSRNKRSVAVSLTPLGKKIFDRSKKLMDVELNSMLGTISEKDRNHLSTTLHTILTPLLQKK